MKKAIYVAAFTLLGLQIQFLVHAFVEMIMIELLHKDLARYGLGLTLDQWYVVHDVGTVIFLAAGAALGLWGGFHWWRIIYVEKRFPWKLKKESSPERGGGRRPEGS